MDKISWTYITVFDGKYYFKDPDDHYKCLDPDCRLSTVKFTHIRYRKENEVCKGVYTYEEENVSMLGCFTIKEMIDMLRPLVATFELPTKPAKPARRKTNVDPHSVSYKTIFDWDKVK